MWEGKKRDMEGGKRTDKQNSISQTHTYIGIYIYIPNINRKLNEFCILLRLLKKSLNCVNHKKIEKRREF